MMRGNGNDVFSIDASRSQEMLANIAYMYVYVYVCMCMCDSVSYLSV